MAKTQKTFEEIWSALTRTEQNALSSRIISECMVADSTIRCWRLGHRYPGALHQKALAKCLKKALGTEVDLAYLFPGSDVAEAARRQSESK